MIRPLACGAALLFLADGAQAPAAVTGIILDLDARPIAGVLVTVSAAASPVDVTVVTGPDGRFRVRPFTEIALTLRAHRADLVTVVRDVRPGADLQLSMQPADTVRRTAADLLQLLPAGERKQRFILDCTGCHQFDAQTIMAPDRSRLKSRDEWRARTEQMIQFAGAASGFPIMAPSRDADSTAAWLTRHLGTGQPSPGSRPPVTALDRPGPPVVITEYAMPVPQDLPHDLIVGPDGKVVITGMMTHRMYVLDPATGAMTSDSIPVPFANPRAVEVAEDGTWWVLLGAPRKVARRDPSGGWTAWDIGMYPHSIGLGADGLVWFNGHFTRDPERLGSLDPRSGVVTTYGVPTPPQPDGGSTIPYELRLGPDGTVWVSQLAGGRLVRFDPATAAFALRTLSTPASGPRRFDVDTAGVLWIPEYANNRLVRYDPSTDAMRSWELPVSDALPYVVRVDNDRSAIWIGTGAADVLFRFDPVSERFSAIPLPTPGALVRHLDIDRRTGDVWLAYGASPSREPAKVARVQAPD